MRQTLLLDGASVETEGVDIARALEAKDAVLWVDIQDLAADEEALGLLQSAFGFHPLSIEDCLFPQRHGKFEVFERYLFFTAQGAQAQWTPKGLSLAPFELDVFIGRNFLVTVRDRGPELDSLRARVTSNPSVYAGHLDRVLHGVLTTVYRSFEPLVENLGERVEKMQERMLSDADRLGVKDILILNRALLEVRRLIEPQAGALGGLLTELREYLPRRSSAHLRDLLFSLHRLERAVGLHAQLLSGSLDVYYASLSASMNRTVKYLTVLATISAPPLFVVSYYGMNVPFPEQNLGPWALAVAWVAMVGLTTALIAFLKRKKLL